MVTMIALVAIVLGVVSMKLLPISLIPEVDVPYITVQVEAPGMSARELDESIITPLRHQLVQVSGLEDISTESKDGGSTITLAFSHGTDISYSFIEVNEKIDRSMSYLSGIERPKVQKFRASDIPAFYLDMTLSEGSSSTFTDMSRFAQDVVSRRIEQLDEVAMVDISGLVREEVFISPDSEKLKQVGMTLADFENVIRGSNIQLGILSIHDGEYSYNVRFLSNVGSEDDIRDIWFSHNGRLLQVGDVADVSVRPAKRTGLVRSNGQEALSLAVIKQSEARMADPKSGIGSLLEQFSADYPDVRFELTRDQTELLQFSINNLIRNIIMAIILACMVIFFFMKDFRSPALVSLTIPVALVISMNAFHLLGLSINIISLSGLLLGVGMMVDNSIILVDNITDRWHRYGDLKNAVVDGTREVAAPMLSSVLTTCAVFIPLVFTSGIAGSLFYDQAMAITVVLLVSYFVTVTVIPVYYWCLYKGMTRFRENPLLARLSVQEALFRWDNRVIGHMLNHPGRAWSILVLSLIGLAICFAFIPKERLPEMRYSESILKVDWNSHVSVEENERRTAMLESCVCSEALHTTSYVGSQQFLLSHSDDQSSSESSIYMKFADQQSLLAAQARLQELISKEYPDAIAGFKASGNIFDMVFADRENILIARLRPSNRPDIDPGLLDGTIRAIREALPDCGIDHAPMKTDVLFVADPERMALYGVTYSQLDAVLRNALNENNLFDIVQGARTLPVVTGNGHDDLNTVLSRTVVEVDGFDIPVSEVMRQTFIHDLKSIMSGPDGNYYPLDMDMPGSKVRETITSVSSIVRSMGNFDVTFAGSWFSSRKMVKELSILLIIAILLLYLILASQFESLSQPLIILSEVVIDIFVSLLSLWLLGISINIMSMIGLIVICGIVVNDSILKIDTINRMIRDGKELQDAIFLAGKRRLKAIVMTSLTTVLSVLPFLSRGSMGADLQYPMSVVIIVGMSVGTLVSLFVLPAMYYSIHRKQTR